MRSSHKQSSIANFGQKELNCDQLAEHEKTNFELADEFGLVFKDLKQFKKMINRN